MMTWKVRGAAAATPEPVSTPMAMARTISISGPLPAKRRSWPRFRLFFFFQQARVERWPRTDWWAIAVRISMVEPTTRANTPISKKVALARCTRPPRQREVEGVAGQEGVAGGHRPGRCPAHTAGPRQSSGAGSGMRLHPLRARDDVLQQQATENTSPATKPPPGWLWPRTKIYTATSVANGSSRRTSTAGTIR
jgi:hypothetical protein